LRLHFLEEIPKQYQIPNSFNYFGLLGPSGKDFGQMLYHCKDCVLEGSAFKSIQLQVREDTSSDINFDAIIHSDLSQVAIELREVPVEPTNNTSELAK
jgi:hypothetical protein